MTKIVLVVEDHPIIRGTTALFLCDAGYHVLEASNANAAILMLESRSDIRAVFSDITMPGSMDGLKLIHAVRERWPPVVLILASGRAPPLVTDMPVDTVFLGKPYRHSDVLDLLEAVDWEAAVAA